MTTIHKNALAEKIEQAEECLRACRLCPRDCDVDRLAGETGYCGLTGAAHCFREVLHYGEESVLNPSHQIYFTGCNLRCEWCAVSEYNLALVGAFPELDVAAMRECILKRLAEGARTVNFLGGEPTVSVLGILKIIAELPPEAKIVWNSNMYFSQPAADLLDGAVDLYLADFKCGNDACAKALLDADDYLAVVRENLVFAQSTAELIIRHLVLPGHESCCLRPILEWIAGTLPEAKVSLRRDYMPPARARAAPSRLLTDEDYRAAVDMALSLGLNLIE